jgi:hypothetical protein
MLSCLLFAVVVQAVQGSVAPPVPKLHIEAAKSSVLIGEPLKVTVSWTATQQLQINPEALQYWIDSGIGFERHIETHYETAAGLLGPVTLDPSRPLMTSDVLAVKGGGLPGSGKMFEPALSRVGVVQVKAIYGAVESNVVSVAVVQPSDADAQLYFGYLRGRPELMTDWALMNLRNPSDTELLRQLITSFPQSAYLERAHLLVWRAQITEALRREEPDPLRGQLGSVLEEIQGSNALTGTPFDDERLFLIATTRLDWRDRAGAVAVLREIIEKYPNGAAAQVARGMVAELGDSTPPTIVLSPSPSELWPPDHKMAPIVVTVRATDDVDPHPVVNLVSVTCNDGCDPAKDVADATLDTDDRQFQLRAERLGTGSGRTYTITYSATDASGNTATKTTTVIVPHDQRTTSK